MYCKLETEVSEARSPKRHICQLRTSYQALPCFTSHQVQRQKSLHRSMIGLFDVDDVAGTLYITVNHVYKRGNEAARLWMPGFVACHSKCWPQMQSNLLSERAAAWVWLLLAPFCKAQMGLLFFLRKTMKQQTPSARNRPGNSTRWLRENLQQATSFNPLSPRRAVTQQTY